MPVGELPINSSDSVTTPSVVIDAILLALNSVNKRLFPVPGLMMKGWFGVGKSVMSIVGVTLAITAVKALAIQMLPSGPAAMEPGESTPVNSVITPVGVMRPNLPWESIRRRQHESSKYSGREIMTPDSIVGLIGEPDIAIRPRGDAHAHSEKGELALGDVARWRDKGDLTGRAFAEPDITVWTRSDEGRVTQGRGDEVTDLTARSDTGDFVAIREGEPEVAVRAHGDRERLRTSPDRERTLRYRLGGGTCHRKSDHGKSEAKFRVKFPPKSGDHTDPIDLTKVSCHGATLDGGVSSSTGNRLQSCYFSKVCFATF